MTSTKIKPLILPALRGLIGDWVYYVCLLDLKEVGYRIQYANEVHNNQGLSDMIQRHLNRARSQEIAKYLQAQQERFLGSLIVAIHKGQPYWFPLSHIRNSFNAEELEGLSEEHVASLGLLTLQGDEKIFALDGQHRLSGIKRFLKENRGQDSQDQVSVIFVGHEDSNEGMERTRRLFTTVSKTAKSVSKGDVIALDEDDVMALSVRWLIDKTELFPGAKLAFVATSNMPASNRESLTTIGNLYDVLTILFSNVQVLPNGKKIELKRMRPSDEDLECHFRYAKKYFMQLKREFPELKDFFEASDTRSVVERYRGPHGGQVLFRPLGLEIFTRVIAQLAKNMPLEEAIDSVAKLPRELASPPYEGLMWDTSAKTIINVHKVTLREILLYMLGKDTKYKEDELAEKLRTATGNKFAQLPARI